MNIKSEYLNALYLGYQGMKIKRISQEDWYNRLLLYQTAILEDNEEQLEKELIETLSMLKK